MGFTKLLRSPEELVRSYRTISPLPDEPDAHKVTHVTMRKIMVFSGGIFSVALSFASPRLHVMEHPALWCSDFPPETDVPGDRLFYFGLKSGRQPVNNALAIGAKLDTLAPLQFIVHLGRDIDIAAVAD